MKNIDRNLTMLCDFYELTMANGYEKCGMGDMYVYFDVFYRPRGLHPQFPVFPGCHSVSLERPLCSVVGVSLRSNPNIRLILACRYNLFL